tara:strand:+ start:631 stop:732 length:102 start_codon:yes stop_codon:yes gene_type:complete
MKDWKEQIVKQGEDTGLSFPFTEMDIKIELQEK